MKLKEYLDDYGIPIAAFARKAGVSAQTIHNILDERGDLRLSVGYRIETLTKYRVTCQELLPDDIKDDIRRDLMQKKAAA